MSAAKPLSLKARAIALLAQREHSLDEMRRKLMRLARDTDVRRLTAAREALGALAAGPDPTNSPARSEALLAEAVDSAEARDARAETVEALLQALQQQGYLSETRFVETRIHARAARYGNRRIQQELHQHGLSLDEEQLAHLRASELQRAREVWRRKFGDAPPRDAASQAKQLRFLAARGFSSEIARQILRGISDE